MLQTQKTLQTQKHCKHRNNAAAVHEQLPGVWYGGYVRKHLSSWSRHTHTHTKSYSFMRGQRLSTTVDLCVCSITTLGAALVVTVALLVIVAAVVLATH